MEGQTAPIVQSKDLRSPADGAVATLAAAGPAARSRGEIEAAICREINRFERDHLGSGPDQIRAHLIGDLLIVRLQGVLTAQLPSF